MRRTEIPPTRMRLFSHILNYHRLDEYSADNVFYFCTALHGGHVERELSRRGHHNETRRRFERNTFVACLRPRSRTRKLRGLEAVWYSLGLQRVPPTFHVSVLVHGARVVVPRGHFLEGGVALVQLHTSTEGETTTPVIGKVSSGRWYRRCGMHTRTNYVTVVVCQHTLFVCFSAFGRPPDTRSRVNFPKQFFLGYRVRGATSVASYHV